MHQGKLTTYFPSFASQSSFTTSHQNISNTRLSTSTLTFRRRPGRPKKFEEIDTTTLPRRGRSAKKSLDLTNGDNETDTSYEPTESDPLEGDESNTETDWEIGALAWGILSAGGLGVGNASVYGAEVVGR